MGNKLFAFLVIVLVSLIIASIVGLVISINRYNEARFPDHKPSVLTESSTNNQNNSSSESTIENNAIVTTETNNSEYILPSDTKEITEVDLIGMDYDTLNKAYNEIFARHGHDFTSKALKDYFNEQSWYKPINGKIVGVSELTEVENKNLNTIKERISKIK